MKFSVVIPAYKKTYLKECIDSVLAQTFTDFEVVIVNDASPENIGGIVKEYKDSRIRYYVNNKNCGAVNVVDNWNICLKYAKGEYIICMGDDDCLKPNCLDEYDRLIKKYPNLKVYHAWAEYIDENSNVYAIQSPRPEFEGCMSLLWNRWHGRRQFIGDFCYETNELRINNGFYKLPLAWASDDITAVRAAYPNGIANTSKICFQYRRNRYTISTIGSAKLKAEAIEEEKRWYVLFLEKVCERYNTVEPESIFFKMILEEIDSHFSTKIYDTLLMESIKGKIDVLQLIKLSRKYGLSIKDIFKLVVHIWY